MTPPVKWTRRAVRWLDQIGAYIARDNPDAASRVVDRIITLAELLAITPAMGQPGRIRDTRELVVRDYRYVIAYRVTGDSVDILTVIHTAQMWPENL